MTPRDAARQWKSAGYENCGGLGFPRSACPLCARKRSIGAAERISALGQKRTYAVQKGMSALPQERTCAVQLAMRKVSREERSREGTMRDEPYVGKRTLTLRATALCDRAKNRNGRLGIKLKCPLWANSGHGPSVHLIASSAAIRSDNGTCSPYRPDWSNRTTMSRGPLLNALSRRPGQLKGFSASSRFLASCATERSNSCSRVAFFST